jgi:hypothetical protein
LHTVTAHFIDRTGNRTGTATDTSGLAPVSLDDKYTATEGAIYLSGIQALVRLPMLQQPRPCGGPEHGRLHFRLSRLAAGRSDEACGTPSRTWPRTA